MGMFEKGERQRREQEMGELRQEVSKELAAMKRALSSLEANVAPLKEQHQALQAELAGHGKVLNDSSARLNDRMKRLDSLMACPHCGLVVDIEKVPITGGLLRPEGKRCPFCDSGSLFDEPPLLSEEGKNGK